MGLLVRFEPGIRRLLVFLVDSPHELLVDSLVMSMRALVLATISAVRAINLGGQSRQAPKAGQENTLLQEVRTGALARARISVGFQMFLGR
jgi:hypothetical protein